MSAGNRTRGAASTVVTLLTLALVTAVGRVGEIAAQSNAGGDALERPDRREGVLYRVGSGFGFLITSGEGFDDRPDVQLEGGVQFGAARPGGPPKLGLTGAFTVGAAHFMGGTYTSVRLLTGVEFPWTLSRSIELVPAAQVGYLKAFEQDERHGFTSRWGVEIRVLPAGGAFYYGFEPIALVTLPLPKVTSGVDAGSRVAPELGLLRFGWRF